PIFYNYSLQAVTSLFDMGCELIVIACNTASAKALRNIQQNDLTNLGADKRVLGVIRPSTENIGQLTKTRHVGILGTEGTVRSESYVIEIGKFFDDITVVQEACPLWVPLIENNQWDTEGGHFFITHHINNLISKDSEIDTIILGCTHYPILKELIESIVTDIRVIAQGEIVADRLKDYLKRHPEMESRISKNGSIKYLTTENPLNFDENARLFLDKEIKSER